MYEVEEQWHAPVCLESVLHKTACIKEKLLQCKSTIPSRAESNQADKNRIQFKKLHKTTQANFNWSSPTMYFPLLLVTLCAAALHVFTVAGQYRQLLYHYRESILQIPNVPVRKVPLLYYYIKLLFSVAIREL